jgi:hypothetical protein
MDTIIGRTGVGTGTRSLELATAEWLKATRRLTRAALAVTLDVLVNTSRAGLLVRGGVRRRRRL